MFSFKDTLIENPIIAAIKNDDDLKIVLNTNVKIVIVLYGNLLKIIDICEPLKKAGKLVFIHIEMIDGLKNDESGIQYIKEKVNPFGIVTTKQTQLKYAKHLMLHTILRIFMVDSKSLMTGIKNIKEFRPDIVEIMPGISSKTIKTIQKNIELPIIAGGLIETKKEVLDILQAGAVAISTTNKDIWKM